MRRMINRNWVALVLAAAALLGWGSARAQHKGKAEGPRAHGRTSYTLAKQGYFYVAGAYDTPAAPTSMSGQMYVEYQIPAELRAGAYPIIMVHGGGHTGAGFQSTPDGRPGWADYFVGHGWPVYVVDQPGRAKSPYVDAVYGSLGSPPAVSQAQDLWAASEKASPAVRWPQATLHTQWPGDGSHLHGDQVFDQYYAHLAPGIGNGALQERLTANALVALLEKLGPSVVLIHSQPGTALWVMADTRPDLVKALVAVEPSGPPIYNETVPNPPFAGPPVTRPWGPSINRLTYEPAATDPSQLSIVHQAQPDGPGLTACWFQAEPARQLPRLARLPILHLLSESSYHAPYDHCTTKWLNQAGVATDFVKLTDLGIFGNGHLMAVEKNNLEIAGVIEQWLVQTLGHGHRKPKKLPETKGSVGKLELAEQGVFFVGGAYNDPINPTFMSGQMYVRYQIPKQRKKGAYPVVLVHGGGQLGTSFTGTPDDRSGWADYLLRRGFPVYVVDQPGRGKSPYITAVYGPRGVPNLQSIEDLFIQPEPAKVARGYALMFEEIRRLRDEVRADGARLSLAVVPEAHQVGRQPHLPLPEERIAAFARAEGLPLIDPLPDLRALGPDAYLDHVHLSASGSARLAQVVLGAGIVPAAAASTAALRESLVAAGISAEPERAPMAALDGPGSHRPRACRVGRPRPDLATDSCAASRLP